MTSIIVCAFDQFKWQRHITLLALNCIRRFTSGEYELILVDTGPQTHVGGPYNRWEVVKPDKHIQVGDIGYSAAMNLGAKNADPKSEYFVFMHNDVFVQEGWLQALIKQIKLGRGEMIYPDQIARSRREIEDIYAARKEGRTMDGYDESGLILMQRSAFEQTGGWDEDFKGVYQDLAFIIKIGELKLPIRRYCTTDTFVSHIGSVTYAYSDEVETLGKGREAPILQDKYGHGRTH